MFKQIYNERFMRFKDGKSKAVTFSYDDGVAADKKLLQIFNRKNLKCAFNLNNPLYGSGKHGTMDEGTAFSAYKDCGQEIALHGDKHLFLNKIPLPEAALEIIENRKYLEDKYGCIVNGMAYAYSGYNDEVVALLKSLGVNYARTTESSYSFDIPKDWLRLKPTCHHGDKRLFSLAEEFINSEPDGEYKKREPLLFFVWGHSYEFDDNGNWDVIEKFTDGISGRQNIWYATPNEIYGYVKSYESLMYSLDGERVFNPSHETVWLDIRGRIYAVESGKQIKL